MTALRRVERVRIVNEGNGVSTFGIDASASIANFKDLRYDSIEVTLGQEMLSDDRTVQRAYEEPEHIIGPKFCEAQITLPLTGFQEPLTSGTTIDSYDDTALGMLLRTICGGYRIGVGSTEDNGNASTTTGLYVTSSAGFSVGGAMGYLVSGRLEAREIDDGATPLVPKIAFSSAATNLQTVYNCETFYPLTDAHSTIDSLQLVVETTERDNIYWLMGMQATSLSIECALGQHIKATVGLRGVNWVQDDSAGTPLGGSSLSAASYTDGDPVPHLTSKCFFVTGSEPYTIAEVDPSSITYTINLKHEPLPAPGGVNGVRRWVRVPQRPMAEVEFVIPVNSGDIKTYQTARDNRTIYSWAHQVGSQPSSSTGSGAWLITLPSVQIMDVQRVESSGLHGARIRCKAIEDQDIGTSTDLIAAPFRMHRF